MPGGRWPVPDTRPSAKLRRHLFKVHGIHTDGTETRADLDEAEGWASEHRWDKSCSEFAVNQTTLRAIG